MWRVTRVTWDHASRVTSHVRGVALHQLAPATMSAHRNGTCQMSRSFALNQLLSTLIMQHLTLSSTKTRTGGGGADGGCDGAGNSPSPYNSVWRRLADALFWHISGGKKSLISQLWIKKYTIYHRNNVLNCRGIINRQMCSISKCAGHNVHCSVATTSTNVTLHINILEVGLHGAIYYVYIYYLRTHYSSIWYLP